MLSVGNQLASAASSLSLGEGFKGLGFSFPGTEAGSSAPSLGVSTSAAPLISAPVARQSSEFQALIAPPTRPSNPSIAPPTTGNEANALPSPSLPSSSLQIKLAFDAALSLQTTSANSNGPSGYQNAIFLSIGNGFGR